MMRHKLLNALLIASLSAMTVTVTAQTTAPAQNNTPRNPPVGTTGTPPTGTTSGRAMAPDDSTMKAPGMAMDSNMPTDMKGYKRARAA
jgi:hypothetical protein